MNDTTLHDQQPNYVQHMTATRNQWQAIYDAIPPSDSSGIAGEIDACMDGEDFEAEITIKPQIPFEVETIVTASIKTGIPVRYGVVERQLCNGDGTCNCARPADWQPVLEHALMCRGFIADFRAGKF